MPGRKAFKGVLKINKVLWGHPNLMGLVSRRRGCGDRAQRRGPVRTRQAMTIPEPGREASEETSPADSLTLKF